MAMKGFTLVSLLLTLICICGPLRAEDTVASIEACMRANVPDTLQAREFDITSTDKSGSSRVFSGRLYARLDGKRMSVMMSVTAPSDMRGAAYLVLEAKEAGADEEMYIYLPALRKAKRISGGMRDKSLFGTDISYSELKQITYAFSDESVVLDRSESLEDRPSWIMSMTPDLAAGGRFDKIVAWVDKKSCMVLRAEYKHKDKVLKQFSSSAAHLAQSGTYWYLRDAVIEDFQEGSQTRLQVQEVLSDKDLANRLFNPSGFYLIN